MNHKNAPVVVSKPGPPVMQADALRLPLPDGIDISHNFYILCTKGISHAVELLVSDKTKRSF